MSNSVYGFCARPSKTSSVESCTIFAPVFLATRLKLRAPKAFTRNASSGCFSQSSTSVIAAQLMITSGRLISPKWRTSSVSVISSAFLSVFKTSISNGSSTSLIASPIWPSDPTIHTFSMFSPPFHTINNILTSQAIHCQEKRLRPFSQSEN